jgi:Macrocin-O-methyltransferase (TylF)
MTDCSGYTQQNRSSQQQLDNRKNLYALFEKHPLPIDQLMINLGLFIRSGALAKILWLQELYEHILHMPGAIIEFGVWWGQTLALMKNFRAIYEPYNHSRRIIGFDTFKGYASISNEDVVSDTIKPGGYAVSDQYDEYLNQLLAYHQQENVLSHIKKHELIKGDATETIGPYLAQHQELIVALAIFDMALYQPTKKCLEAIKPRLVKGSVLAFDELNSADYPGETMALRETLEISEYSIKRSKFLPDRTFLIIE